MITRYITENTPENIAAAADILAQSGLAAVPTETVYGLAGNALDETAAEKIYNIKGRPAGKPLSVMVPGAEAMARCCRNIPRAAYILARKFWPGPLTIVLPARTDIVPDVVRAGGETVALRCPDCAVTLDLLKACEFPLAVPSANPSGAPSPKNAQTVADYFDGQIEAIIDGGPCTLGTESTIVDLTVTPFRVLRQGILPEQDVRDALAEAGMYIVGITGGTGTGKTTALDALRDRGALLIDGDAVYHELCRDNKQMLAEIEAMFPGSVENGVLQRKKLGAVVFADPEKLAALTALTGGYIHNEIVRRLNEFQANGGTLAAIDAINLLGGDLEELCSVTVGITAPEEERVRRLMLREGITADYALLRIRAQKPREYFEENCDHTIPNDGTREEYRARCDALFDTLIQS